jgi:hypothetical protein
MLFMSLDITAELQLTVMLVVQCGTNDDSSWTKGIGNTITGRKAI